MDWNQTFTILISFFGLMLWIIREMKQDKISLQVSMEKIAGEITKESRDFHGRLCALEEKYKQMEKK